MGGGGIAVEPDVAEAVADRKLFQDFDGMARGSILIDPIRSPTGGRPLPFPFVQLPHLPSPCLSNQTGASGRRRAESVNNVPVCPAGPGSRTTISWRPDLVLRPHRDCGAARAPWRESPGRGSAGRALCFLSSGGRIRSPPVRFPRQADGWAPEPRARTSGPLIAGR